MGSRSQSNVFQALKVERLAVDYLHLNQAPIRLNGYPFGTADLPNTANFVSQGSLQQPDWLTVNPSSITFIKNKPVLSRVALSGAYSDLTGAPSVVPTNADWSQTDTSKLDFIKNKPTISTAGASGKYSDLVPASGQPVVPTSVDYNAVSSSQSTLAILNKPQIPPAPVNADWNVTSASSLAFVKNKPSLSAVALSGSFSDLLNKPTVYQSVDWNANANSGSTLAIANRPSIPAAQVNSDWNASTGAAAILNKPTIPSSQVNSDWNVNTGAAAILNKPTIPSAQVNSDWNASSGSVAYIANKPALGRTATSNNYGDLNDLPTIPAAQQPTDWNATMGVTSIQNKPALAAVATSGKYSDLVANSGQTAPPSSADWSLSSSTASSLAIKNKPAIPAAQVQSDWGQSDNTQISFINNKPSLATVASSGSYNDLTNKPVVSGNVQANWTQADSSQASFIQNKPSLSAVASSGKYSDLVANSGQPSSVTAADWNATSASAGVVPVRNKPTIPAAQVNSDWNSTSGVSQILNQPTFGAVAFSNSYPDLSNKPTITAPVNADWNSVSGLSQILNKPSLGLVATSNNYGDLTHLPTLPTQVDYSLTSSSGTSLAIANKPTSLSSFTNDVGYYKANDSPTFGSVAATNVSLKSGNALTLAADLSGSIAALAGTLAYNPPGGACTPASASSGSVDVYGAGTSSGSRLLNLWDLVTVQGTLTVSGATSLQAITATTVSAASLSTTGNATIAGTLAVTGSSSVQDVTATTLTASGAVSTGALTAASVSTGGNLMVTGTAAIAGATSTHALTATSLSTSGTLGVSGVSTLAGVTATSVSNSGNETVGGTLNVSGVCQLSTTRAATLSTTGNVTIGGTLSVSGSAGLAALSAYSISSTTTLNVSGATTLAAASVTTLNASGNTTVGGTLGVTGATILAATTVGALTSSSISNSGNATVGGTLGVTGAVSTGALTSSSVTSSGSVFTSTIDGSSSSSNNLIYICPSGLSHVWTLGAGGNSAIFNGRGVYSTDNVFALGQPANRWTNVYSCGLNISGSNVINLGYDQTKEAAAGKIGYGTYTVGALDIVGGGTAAPRTIKLWDNVTIPGTLSCNNKYQIHCYSPSQLNLTASQAACVPQSYWSVYVCTNSMGYTTAQTGVFNGSGYWVCPASGIWSLQFGALFTGSASNQTWFVEVSGGMDNTGNLYGNFNQRTGMQTSSISTYLTSVTCAYFSQNELVAPVAWSSSNNTIGTGSNSNGLGFNATLVQLMS